MAVDTHRIDEAELAMRGMYEELDRDDGTGAESDIRPGDIPPIRRAPIMEEIRNIVADTIDFAGTEFAGANITEYYLLIDRSDLAEIRGEELQSLFFAAAFCAEKEDNPEYLRYLEEAFKRKNIALDRKYAYQKAVKLLQYKRRYDLYMVVSPYFAYRSTTRRVFHMAADESIRLDLIEKDPSIVTNLARSSDIRGLITLISYGILSIGTLSPETVDRLFTAIAETDSPKRRMAIAHLSQKYTLESIISTLERALGKRETMEEGIPGMNFTQVVLKSLIEDAKYVEELVADTGTTALDAIADMANPRAYSELRAIVPTEESVSEPVELYPAPAMRRLMEKRERTLKGESIPVAVSALKALASAGKIEEYREASFIALDTIVENLASLVYDLEHNIQSDHTRVTLAFDTLALLIDATTAAYALHHYGKEPRVFRLITRIKALETGLSGLLDTYASEHRNRLDSGSRAMGGLLEIGSRGQSVETSLDGRTPESAKIERSLESLRTASLLHMDDDAISLTREVWEDYVSLSSHRAPGITPERLEVLRKELEYLYKRTIKARFQSEGIVSEFISKIPFQSREKVISEITGYGHQSVPDEKDRVSQHYRALATNGVAGDLLDMLSVLSLLEVRYLYSADRSQ